MRSDKFLHEFPPKHGPGVDFMQADERRKR